MNELSLFNSLFDDRDFGFAIPAFTKSCNLNMPKVDVKETKDAYILDMDLPGRTEKDVDVDLKDNVLTIASHEEEKNEKKEKKEEKAEDGEWLIRERRTTEFSRRFSLPQDVDAENVNATFKNGVLTISIGRKTLAQAKKIAITAA